MRGTIEGDDALGVDEIGYETYEDDTARRHRAAGHWVIAALVVVVLAAVALLGFRSGAGEQTPAASRAPATTQPDPPTTAAPADQTPAPAPTTPTTTAEPATPAPAEPAEHATPPPVIEDGRHPAYVTGIDAGASTLEFDVVQYLTGHDADEYVEAHPDEYPGLYEEEGGYPYDALVANENPRLRTLPVTADAQVVVLQTDQSTYSAHTIRFADLPGYFAQHSIGYEENDNRLFYSVFWLTVHDGEIVAMEEQFQA